MNRFILKNTFIKVYIYHFLIFYLNRYLYVVAKWRRIHILHRLIARNTSDTSYIIKNLINGYLVF